MTDIGDIWLKSTGSMRENKAASAIFWNWCLCTTEIQVSISIEVEIEIEIRIKVETQIRMKAEISMYETNRSHQSTDAFKVCRDFLLL